MEKKNLDRTENYGYTWTLWLNTAFLYEGLELDSGFQGTTTSSFWSRNMSLRDNQANISYFQTLIYL